MEKIERVLKEVSNSFFNVYNKDEQITKLFKKVTDKTATYIDAAEYAVRVGDVLAKAYKSNLEISFMEYETALQLLNDPLYKNYELISRYCENVQVILNKNYGMSIKSLVPDFNLDRLYGLAKAISEAEDEETIIRLFSESVINFSQSIVDDSVEKNAEFANELGLKPKLIREYEGPHNERGHMVDCQYCKDLAGTYDYEDVKAKGSDVYKRHEGCRCTVTYMPTANVRQKMTRSGNAFTRF